MIYDLIDGQLSADQMRQAQQLIAEDVELAELYQSLREQQNALRAMPKFELDDDFANRVVRAAQAEGLLQPSTPNTLKLAPPTDTRNWWAPAVAITALAAMLLVTLFIVPNISSPTSVARNDSQKPDNGLALEKANKPDAMENETTGPEQFQSAPGSLDRTADMAMDSEADGMGEIESANALSDPNQPGAIANQATPRVARGHAPKALRNRGLTPMIEILSPASNADESRQPNMMMARREPTDNRVLVFRVPEKDATIREINKAFSENGIIVGLPETAAQRMDQAEYNRPDKNNRRAKKREFAYEIQTTPAQMQKAVVALRNKTEIVAVGSSDHQSGLGGDEPPLMIAQNTMRAATENGMAQELRIQSFGAAKMLGDTPQEGSGAGGQAETQSDVGAADDVNNSELAKDTMEELRSIDDYFGLKSGELTPQSYTLIFMLDDAVAAAEADTLEQESDASPSAASGGNDQLP